MILDVLVDKDSATFDIGDPFHADISAIVGRIREFVHAKGADISGLDIQELIPKMIKGIAGCEKGCPADAKGIVSRGFVGFELQYIEGGILSAHALLKHNRHFYLKMFPDF
jgi:hypothetical protein